MADFLAEYNDLTILARNLANTLEGDRQEIADTLEGKSSLLKDKMHARDTIGQMIDCVLSKVRVRFCDVEASLERLETELTQLG